MTQHGIIDFHVHPRYDFHLANHGVKITVERFRDELLANGITAACGSVIWGNMMGKEPADYEEICIE